MSFGFPVQRQQCLKGKFIYFFNFYLKTKHIYIFFRFPIKKASALTEKDYDGIILIHTPGNVYENEKINSTVLHHLKIDPSLEDETVVLPLSGFPCEKLILASTGALDVDYDDVRSFKLAAAKGTKRAVKAGVKRPLIYLQEQERYQNAPLVTLLGVLEALHVVSLLYR